jgi:predicted ArsR family transcriptional regulator
MVSRRRAQIVDFLDRHPSASADEISQAFDVTKENIQYHLKTLLQDGIIQRTTLSAGKQASPGRPTYLYRLSDQSRQGNLPALADKFLTMVINANPSPAVQLEILRQLAGVMFPYQPATSRALNLRQTIQRLNKQHYQATWEARAAGPYVYFRNCPYASIIRNHPELCRLDCAILTSMLHSGVTQISKMDLDSRKPPTCTFLIHTD